VNGAPPGVRTVQVGAAAGRALRMSVLRPHEPPDRPMYPAEDDPSTLHFASLAANGEVLAVGSAMPDPHPADPREGDWRIRGMATRPDLRGRSLGARVLDALERAARERGGRRMWCNARSGARDFYARAGYEIEGGEFEIAGIGPHFRMVKRLR
jgi:GNAT superfamily N-acetyltransferase